MIEKNGDEYVLRCHKCGAEKTGFGAWAEVVDFKKAKDSGWGCRKEKDGDWMDLCPECIGQWNNAKYGINKKTTTTSKQEIQKNFTNPVMKGWEILKGVDEERIKLGQKIRLVISDSTSSSMQNSGETFIFNGLGFVNASTQQWLDEQMTLVSFGTSNFEYVV
jgi:hypothetical protein